MRLKKSYLLVLLVLPLIFTSCFSPLSFFGIGGGGGDDDEAAENRAIEPTALFSLALGGVAPGRDELVLYDDNGELLDTSERDLNCVASEDIVGFEPRPGFDSFSQGAGVRIIPLEEGITTITCLLDGVALSKTYEVIIPPQNLIQILLAEAQTQINDEATLDAEVNTVTLNSTSPTADALGSVINNRIAMIEDADNPALFNADAATYDLDPIPSHYNAVILAPNQFSPTNTYDPNYELFSNAQDRNFLTQDLLIAYDQAVLTAADIYANDVNDPTQGAFGFRSPTEEQWTIIAGALASATTEMPLATGVADIDFPAFAPVQIVIVDDVWTYEDGHPSFIFIRPRFDYEPAVISLP
ncbi:MAG: hypothetical protein ABH859_05810 [Pseudomonadota bacterium]